MFVKHGTELNIRGSNVLLGETIAVYDYGVATYKGAIYGVKDGNLILIKTDDRDLGWYVDNCRILDYENNDCGCLVSESLKKYLDSSNDFFWWARIDMCDIKEESFWSLL